jgi:hypothetical protein
VSKENVQELSEAISFMSGNLLMYDREGIRNYVKDKFGQKAFLTSISQVYENVLL